MGSKPGKPHAAVRTAFDKVATALSILGDRRELTAWLEGRRLLDPLRPAPELVLAIARSGRPIPTAWVYALGDDPPLWFVRDLLRAGVRVPWQWRAAWQAETGRAADERRTGTTPLTQIPRGPLPQEFEQ